MSKDIEYPKKKNSDQIMGDTYYDSLEDAVDKLSKRVKKLVKRNGFSKVLKKKAEQEL